MATIEAFKPMSQTKVLGEILDARSAGIATRNRCGTRVSYKIVLFSSRVSCCKAFRAVPKKIKALQTGPKYSTQHGRNTAIPDLFR